MSATVTLEPNNDRLLVKPLSPEEERASGLVIPDMAQDKPDRGTVVAVGPGPEAQVFAVNDQVVYSRYGGIDIEVDGERMLVLRAEDVLATVRDAA